MLFDVNVLIDIACRWQLFPESLTLYNQIVVRGGHEGRWPACGYTTVYYLLEQFLSEPESRSIVNRFQETLLLLPFTATTAEKALGLPMKDLEDACIAATAFEGGCQVIATRNVEDYAGSPTPAQSPGAILRLLRRR